MQNAVGRVISRRSVSITETKVSENRCEIVMQDKNRTENAAFEKERYSV